MKIHISLNPGKIYSLRRKLRNLYDMFCVYISDYDMGIWVPSEIQCTLSIAIFTSRCIISERKLYCNTILDSLMLVYFSVFLTDQHILRICRMKMFSVSHKTVFVVDHCPYMAESSRQQVECDVLTKTRAQGVIPLAPVSKSLWTCAVECSMEYCRILYDIYPVDKLVSFIIII